ncbi:leucine-rich repeat protein [Eggerthellaceae bacterium zg-893]|nr:leucine-rich repeat protein [Eggerthellaceae bacterium zg-893]
MTVCYQKQFAKKRRRTMALKAALCPSCGASIEIPSDTDKCFCAYCGNQIMTQAAIAYAKVQVDGVVQTRDADFVIRGGVLEKYNGSERVVHIPDGVVSIRGNAFAGLAVEEVSLPSSLIEINEGAFRGCNMLKKIVVPNSVTRILDDAFRGCCLLKEIVLPDSVTHIGSRAFSSCSCLEEIVIPDSVTYIGNEAFSSCSRLKEIVLPDSVTHIGSGAFSFCACLEKIIILGSPYIGSRAFAKCRSLKRIEMKNVPGERIAGWREFRKFLNNPLKEYSSQPAIRIGKVHPFANCSFEKAEVLEEVAVYIELTSGHDLGEFIQNYYTQYYAQVENKRIEEKNKRIEKENKEQAERQAKYYRRQGLCQYCGGEFRGLLVKKCSRCGKRKDY